MQQGKSAVGWEAGFGAFLEAANRDHRVGGVQHQLHDGLNCTCTDWRSNHYDYYARSVMYTALGSHYEPGPMMGPLLLHCD